MKKYIIILLVALTFVLLPNTVNAKEYKDEVASIVGNKQTDELTLYLFYSATCPHCHEEQIYLKTLAKEYPELKVIKYEVTKNKTNAAYYEEVVDKMDLNTSSVPLTIIGDDVIIGYQSTMQDQFEDVIDSYVFDLDSAKVYNIPIIGKVEASHVSIPAVAIILGFIDGFNPCAMWILLFLINMLFGLKERKKMWFIGLTFLLVSALVYFLAMLGISMVLNIATIKFIQIIIALVAITGGVINLRGYYKGKKEKGCHIVDEKKRKKYFEQIKKITSKSLIPALIGVSALAISVNLVELACSTGFPLIFTSILDINNIHGIRSIGYLLIYILFYLIDDLVIFIIAMVTLKATGVTTKYNNLSKLIGGLIMILIGLLLIFNPAWIMFNF